MGSGDGRVHFKMAKTVILLLCMFYYDRNKTSP